MGADAVEDEESREGRGGREPELIRVFAISRLRSLFSILGAVLKNVSLTIDSFSIRNTGYDNHMDGKKNEIKIENVVVLGNTASPTL
jgi:hypothetical protein